MAGPPRTSFSNTLYNTLLRRLNSSTAVAVATPLTQHRSITTLPAALASQIQEKPKRGEWSRFLLFIPGVATFGLGTWQLFRREDKIKMLEYRQNKLASEAISGQKLASLSEDLEFRRVVCKGLFDEKKSIYVGPRSRSISGVTENGYYIITPFVSVPDNSDSVQPPILVNRGWVPRSWRDKPIEASENDQKVSSIASSPVEKNESASWWRFWSIKPTVIEEQVPTVPLVEVVGIVRGSEKPSIFVPPNDLSKAQWFYVDVPAIARVCGLPENTIYIEEINENINHSHPYPVPKDANTFVCSSVMPQDHLNYMLTWYSLSAAVTFMAFKRLSPKKNCR